MTTDEQHEQPIEDLEVQEAEAEDVKGGLLPAVHTALPAVQNTALPAVQNIGLPAVQKSP